MLPQKYYVGHIYEKLRKSMKGLAYFKNLTKKKKFFQLWYQTYKRKILIKNMKECLIYFIVITADFEKHSII